MTCEICECPEWGETAEAARFFEFSRCEDCAVWRCNSRKSGLARRLRHQVHNATWKANKADKMYVKQVEPDGFCAWGERRHP